MVKVSFIYTYSLFSTPKNLSIFIVVPDGYGLSYSIGDNYIRWTITSMKKNTDELKHHLATSAAQVKTMLKVAGDKYITKM